MGRQAKRSTNTKTNIPVLLAAQKVASTVEMKAVLMAASKVAMKAVSRAIMSNRKSEKLELKYLFSKKGNSTSLKQTWEEGCWLG